MKQFRYIDNFRNEIIKNTTVELNEEDEKIIDENHQYISFLDLSKNIKMKSYNTLEEMIQEFEEDKAKIRSYANLIEVNKHNIKVYQCLNMIREDNKGKVLLSCENLIIL